MTEKGGVATLRLMISYSYNILSLESHFSDLILLI